MEKKFCAVFLASVAAFCAAYGDVGPKIKAVPCVRNQEFDVWAQADCRFSAAVMEEVFRAAGIDTEKQGWGEDGMMIVSNSEVICSAFRTEELEKDYLFPLQPLSRMHFGLYATPSRAMSMMSSKISDWPRMIVGFCPVSQGTTGDCAEFFSHAQLSPKYMKYSTSAGAVQALHNGEIDVLFLYTPFGKRPEGLVEVVPIGERDVYFAVRRDRRDVFEALAKEYRNFYIDHIDKIDEWRETFLGVSKPVKRVRVAAYSRGDLFEVDDKGVRSGSLKNWFKTICGHTHWTLDYVYGGYDESIEAVKDGRLDIIGGIGFSPSRRKNFLFPHTPIGMLRVFLWARPGSPYKPGAPSTWKGMKVGLVSATVSGERAKRQFNEDEADITYREFSTDKAMLSAYFDGEIDACIDVEMQELRNETALHVYIAHPMYICTSKKREDLFLELEDAMEAVCDDFPKYQRMISERHYGRHSEMASLSLDEVEWLARRVKNSSPVIIDFSPWPLNIVDSNGKTVGFVSRLLSEFSRRTGLNFRPSQQTDMSTAEARFLRGETDFWVPFPENPGEAVGGAVPVFSMPVPQSAAEVLGVKDPLLEFEMFASGRAPEELVSIMRKVGNDIGSDHLQDMFVSAIAERNLEKNLFGYNPADFKLMIFKIAFAVVIVVLAFAIVMMILLKRQTNRANAAADMSEKHAQAKTRFLAMMSHELRTPLNAVIGFAEFLSGRNCTERQQKEYVEGLLISSRALLDLINDILDFSKLEAGAAKMREGVCDMEGLLKEMSTIFGHKVQGRDVEFKIERAGREIPLVRLSRQGMRQILINLIGNSVKFTEKGSIAVRIGWRDSDNTLHVEVADTGCGISEDKMGKLFDPFEQDLSARMKQNNGEIKGTGLGLPIVKQMVEAANGSICARSVPGEGTTFYMDFPGLEVVDSGKSSHSAEGGRLLFAALPARVLVVDDMMVNRKILGIHLGNLGIKDIRFAENGRKALEVLDGSWKPDVVFTDMWMPEMDGTQLVKAMRANRATADIPVVAVTADIDVGSTYDMSLFAAVLSKPVTSEKLKGLFGVE